MVASLAAPKCASRAGLPKIASVQGPKCGGVERQSVTGATGMLPDKRSRCSAWRRRERALEGDLGPELPVLTIGDAGDEAAGPPHRFVAQQQVPAIGEQIAHQQALQEIAGGCAANDAGSPRSRSAHGGDGLWRRFECRGQARKSIWGKPVIGIEEEDRCTSVQEFHSSAISCCRNAGIRLSDQCNSRISEGGRDIARAVRRPVIDHHQRPVTMCLRQYRYHRVANPRRRVERGNHDTDVHSGQSEQRLTRKP